MREANTLPGQAATGPETRRFRLASPGTVLVLGGLVLALTAIEWPLAGLAHLSVNAGTGSAPWWAFTPLGVLGLIVAWRRPANPLGWCFVGIMISGHSARTAACTRLRITGSATARCHWDGWRYSPSRPGLAGLC